MPFPAKPLAAAMLCLVSTLCFAEEPAPSVKTSDSPKTRVIHFPKDRALGTLSMQDQNTEGASDLEPLGFAKGDVRVPADKEINLLMTSKEALDLPRLRQLGPNDIHHLMVMSNRLDNEQLKYITHLKGLKSLWLGDSFKLTAVGMERLTSLTSLTNLTFMGAEMDDGDLELLKHLTTLEYINFFDSTITGTGLVHLNNLPSLKHLSLLRTPITNTGMAGFASGFKSLESLDLYDTKVGDEGLAHLKNLPRLRKIALPRNTTDLGLLSLASLPRLEEVNMAQTQITDAGVARVGEIRSLTNLDLSGTAITFDSVQHLKKLRKLQTLSLDNTAIGPKGYELLKEALPDTQISYSPAPQ